MFSTEYLQYPNTMFNRETFEREYYNNYPGEPGQRGFGQRTLELTNNHYRFLKTFDKLMYEIEKEINDFLRRNRHDIQHYLREIVKSVIHRYNNPYSYGVSEEIEKIKKIEMFILGFTKKVETHFHSKYRFYLDQIEREHLSNSVRIIISGSVDCSNHLPYRKALIINPNMFF